MAKRKKSATNVWQSRIVGHGAEDPRRILANPANWRTHPESQKLAMAGVLDTVGWVQDVVLNQTTGHLVDGHLRVEIAIDREEATVPVVYVALTLEEEKLILATFDRITAMAGIDHEKLEELIGQVVENFPDFEVTLAGIADALAEDAGAGNSGPKKGLTAPDEVPQVSDVVISRREDVWLLGPHRVSCGDATIAEDVNRLMGGGMAAMMFTDPPYNVNYDAETRASYFSPERRAKKLGTIKGDRKTPADFRSFLDAVYGNANAVLQAGRGIYVCHADTEGHHFRNAFIAQPWKLQSCLIWRKTVLVFGRADYHWMHEPILYGWKEGASHVWTGDRKQTTIWDFSTDHYMKGQSDTGGKYVHPTQKPVGLIERALENSSSPGEVVLDLFGGSGSTLIACDRLGRVGRVLELDPKYVDVIVRRWQNFTGQEAVLEGSKLPFSKVEAERNAPETAIAS